MPFISMMFYRYLRHIWTLQFQWTTIFFQCRATTCLGQTTQMMLREAAFVRIIRKNNLQEGLIYFIFVRVWCVKLSRRGIKAKLLWFTNPHANHGLNLITFYLDLGSWWIILRIWTHLWQSCYVILMQGLSHSGQMIWYHLKTQILNH